MYRTAIQLNIVTKERTNEEGLLNHRRKRRKKRREREREGKKRLRKDKEVETSRLACS